VEGFLYLIVANGFERIQSGLEDGNSAVHPSVIVGIHYQPIKEGFFEG
jgi:hypothetical protein